MNKKYFNFVNILDFILKINIKIFPFLWSLAVSFMLIETFTYQGFFAKHLLLDMKIFFFLVLVSGLFMMLTLISNPASRYKYTFEQLELIKNLTLLLLPVMTLFSFVLVSQLQRNRNSIIFGGNFLIFPGRFVLANILVFYFLIVYFGIFKYKKYIIGVLGQDHKSFGRILLKIIILLTLVWVLLVSFNKDFTLFRYNVSAVLRDPFASYDKKMINQIGPIYNYYKFVNDNTAPSAVILNPRQQGQWPDVSNQGYTRYFIYPRNLISEEMLDNSKNIITDVFLIGGKKLHDFSKNNRWPDFYVPAKKIVYYPNDPTKQSITVYKNYDPNDQEYSDYWGIIEVDRNGVWK